MHEQKTFTPVIEVRALLHYMVHFIPSVLLHRFAWRFSVAVLTTAATAVELREVLKECGRVTYTQWEQVRRPANMYRTEEINV